MSEIDGGPSEPYTSAPAPLRLTPRSSATNQYDELLLQVHERESERCAVFLSPEEDSHPTAFVAMRLLAVTAIAQKERIAQQSLLLARLRQSTPAFPGVSRAIELRYIVYPVIPVHPVTLVDMEEGVHAAPQRIDSYLVMRLADWRLSTADLAAAAVAASVEIGDLLATTLPAHYFAPVTDPAEIAKALNPFSCMDTVEIRQDDTVAGPLPGVFGGVPTIDEIVELMSRQSAPTAISFCVEPTEIESALNTLSDVSVMIEHVPQFTVTRDDESRIAGSLLAQNDERLANQRFLMQRLAAFRRQIFRLRIQIVSAAPLGAALIGTLTAEVGGPSRLLAEAAWQNPASPIAGSAIPVRPRSAHVAEEVSEATIALRNFAALAFAPWGDNARLLAPYLVDLSEAARLFALPIAATWLDAHAIPLSLSFRERSEEGIILGTNRQTQGTMPVRLPLLSRGQHTWIVGQTGTGKSTLLESLILQDIEAGRGVIVIDPHGELITSIQSKIPSQRAEDVVLFDPADTDFPMALNMLEAHSEEAQAMVVSSFIGLLRKLFDPHTLGIVGPRFEHAVRNGLLTVMSAPDSGTLVELMRVLTDDSFMHSLLPYVRDPIVRRYWEDQIAKTTDFHRSEVLDYVVSKFGPFVTDYTLRRIVGQPHNAFRFREVMDRRQIVLISLAKGRLGATNANFLGLLLLPMILQATLSRADLAPAERRECTLYIDEFQNYATDSLALMLAEARKYQLALVLANQHVGQLTGEIRDAVLGNVGSIITFRLGAADALAMEQILAPSLVHADHLINLPNFTAYSRLLINGKRTPVFTLHTLPPRTDGDPAMITRTRDLSRARYARPRAEVDDEIAQRSQFNPKPPPRADHFPFAFSVRRDPPSPFPDPRRAQRSVPQSQDDLGQGADEEAKVNTRADLPTGVDDSDSQVVPAE